MSTQYEEMRVLVPTVDRIRENRTAEDGIQPHVLAEFGDAAVQAGCQDSGPLGFDEAATDTIGNILHFIAREAERCAPVGLDGERDIDIPHLIDSVLERARRDFEAETFPAARENPRVS